MSDNTIKPGDRIPAATFRTPTADGPVDVTTDEIFAGKTVVLFAVPGAFTPTCNDNHLPGYLELNDELRARGADAIAVVSMNDVFVMKAWAASSGAEGRIQFLADGNGEFTRAVGMAADMSAAGFGTRSRRYSMLVRDGVAETVNIEEGRGKAEQSSARVILEQL